MMQAFFPSCGFSVTVIRTWPALSRALAVYVLHTPPQKVTSRVRPSAPYEVTFRSPDGVGVCGFSTNSGSTAIRVTVFSGPPGACLTVNSQVGTSIGRPSTWFSARPSRASSTVCSTGARLPFDGTHWGSDGDFCSPSSGAGVAQPPMSRPPSPFPLLSAFNCFSASSAPTTG